MHITIIGIGYVGLAAAVAFSYLDHHVVGIEKDPQKLRLLQESKSPIFEPGIEELLDKSRERLSFTNDTVGAVADSDVIMIAVGTPPKKNGEADLCYVEEAARQAAMGMVSGGTYVIVIKSTVPIGTNRRVMHIITKTLAERGVKANVHIASNPEFLRQGMALKDMLYPDRIVVGAETAEAIETLRNLYRPILEQSFAPPSSLPRPDGYSFPPLIITDLTSAEMIKYAANAFLALKISFINEIAGLCEKVGADIKEVARGIGLDPRIGPRFLQAGLGWGGSCFPKDTAALLAVAAEYGYTMPIIEAARAVNTRQRTLIVEKLQSVLKILRGRIIGILGLAFKPGTDDIRESPALDLVRILIERGAHVKVHDPVAMPKARLVLKELPVDYAADPYTLAEGCDAIILATEWETYRQLNLALLAKRMNQPVLIDGRNFFDPEQARQAGFIYMGVGR
ncbi:UDP-glucose dehydrogenase family protein [Thermosediminibacter oceani]|uniref:UDP-glucose 6-dehydrogenase n=1 Tax=Thermosediminibacter oceani (strain ATCC BAA-1034 / DSM 16646 / JW/IW-1228P) TaxID=555079 RepID=D9S1K1_THEOJ|nr:UDP-glucose/GDP-mannose dehydrogenase family protein [Thermosediminibacter oceani]ADL07278.1 nucleotide sugar dehydrogenase [Thermosediminibacter oceani DSM 16646]